MKKKVLKKRVNKFFSSLSISDSGKTLTVGKPLYGREVKPLVQAANAKYPFDGFEDILKFSTFNPSRKYILDMDKDNRMISIIRYCDPGPDRLGYTYLELINLERRRSQHELERKNTEFLEAIDDWERQVFGRPEGTDGVHILYHPTMEPQQWVEVPAVYPELTRNSKFMERWNEFVSCANGLKPHVASIEPILTRDGARACLAYSQAVTRLRNFVYQLKA